MKVLNLRKQEGALLRVWSGLGLSLLLLTTPKAVVGDVLPSTHVIGWDQGVAGIPGGIPYRTKIFTNMPVGATAAQINAAINACPRGEVVFLPAEIPRK